ncbi:hypothetical protein [Paenibacillus whitsoniae]|uniref:Endolytic transglycosylase MltG n=1 Tax=Paenibacillus whitsoniae TaxID=2496558 RepID=A0A3S0CPT7_9BACL|nr:hypothetical protein [Paenibacillus whitsoniae]RTE01805.1 hypothetical protein EJQ19_30635 [Paenibacillus whitsoniae]
MFKNRLFVSGLGIGVIVGAILLEIMLVRPSAAPNTNPSGTISLEEMDPQKLKQEASKYFQVYDLNVKMFTQAELDAAVQKKVKEEGDKAAAAPKTEQQTAKAPPQKIVIYVQPNLDATAVADLLVQSGVIADRNAFAAELAKQGGNYKIQVGFHAFEGVQDMAGIVANLLTQPPK